jgi:hypothetical protein
VRIVREANHHLGRLGRRAGVGVRGQPGRRGPRLAGHAEQAGGQGHTAAGKALGSPSAQGPQARSGLGPHHRGPFGMVEIFPERALALRPAEVGSSSSAGQLRPASTSIHPGAEQQGRPPSSADAVVCQVDEAMMAWDVTRQATRCTSACWCR